MDPNRILGSILGLTLGDAFGAPFEGGVPERITLGCDWKDSRKTPMDRRHTNELECYRVPDSSRPGRPG